MNDGQDLTRLVGDAATVREVFEEMPFMVGGYEGPEYVVIAINERFRSLMGRSGLVGRTLREAMPDLAGQTIYEMFDQVSATGEPLVAREWRVQVEHGESGLTRETFIDFTLTPVPGADGRPARVIAYGVDVTERVREREAAQRQVAEAQRRYEAARDVVAELQRELLPAGVPVMPGVEVAASYLLADTDTAAGGDWFDAVPLPGGRVALVVGDVVGHGVRASAVMGQLRLLLADFLAETGDVVLAMEAVDRVAERVRGARAATVCVVVLDPVDGAVSYCTAGHPPPLVVPAVGEPRFLAATGAGPLATGAGEFDVRRDELAVGDLVLLYTDGVLERPGRSLSGTSVELARVVADVAAGRALRSVDPTTVERVATQSLELLTRATGHADDITLLAAQRVAPVADLAVRSTATPELLSDFRAALGGWLDDAHVAEGDAQAVLHAVGELVTNAVEHAYRDAPEPGPVEVTATVAPAGELWVQVRDEGRWREPPTAPTDRASGRGRGLWMTSRLVDDLTVEHPGGATVAYVRHRLVRPARLLTADALTPAPARTAAPSRTLVAEEREPGVLHVEGPVDGATAPDLEDALSRTGAAGTRPLVVDLSGVTLLASVGVSVLHEVEARSLANGVELRLHAPAGSPADQILTLVALPHTTSGDGLDAGDPKAVTDY